MNLILFAVIIFAAIVALEAFWDVLVRCVYGCRWTGRLRYLQVAIQIVLIAVGVAALGSIIVFSIRENF
jgi:hypothetical protein